VISTQGLGHAEQAVSPALGFLTHV
jgi:hypothetical protein